tara:strand:+ start:1655 stop:4198 length:2544 start_codon:yes stop_codon:yes gene_type:complete
MARQMFGNLTRDLFGDSGRTDKMRPGLDNNFIADILPYRVYDKRRKLFFNRESTGFIIELSPFLGADEKVVSILTEFMSQAIPEKTHMQILNWASPRIGAITNRWLAPRCKTGGVYEELGHQRARYIDGGAWNSLSRHAPFFACNFRTIIAVGIEGNDDEGRIDTLLSLREGLLANLASLSVATTIFSPDDLITFLDEIINMSRTVAPSQIPYTATDPINIQIAKPDTSIITEPGRLLIETITESDYPAHPHGEWQSDRMDVRCYSAPRLPKEWAQWKSARLIGDPFNDQLRFPCPVLSVLCLSFPDQAAMEARAGMKAARSTQQSETPFAKYNPTLHEIAEDWKLTQVRLKDGEKLVKAAYYVIAFAWDGEGDEVGRTLRALYKAAGWALAFERFVQLPTFTAAFPLSLADGLGSDFKTMKRLQTRLTSTCVNIAPMQGEYLGLKEPHLMLLGRRGQPFFWSPFGNDSGNHNVAVLGASGSGKSVLIQEIVSSLRGAGTQVFIIDDGRSFEHSVKLQGGKFVEFRLEAGLCINPFSMVDADRAAKNKDYRTEVLELLKLTILQMCRSSQKASDSEKGLVESAIVQVWNSYADDGDIDKVAAHLKDFMGDDHGRKEASDLARSLTPYTSKGAYGEYFNGRASVTIDNDLMVFEMAELESKKDLRSVVLLSILFLINNTMHSEGRDRKKALVIDESWSLLGDGSTGEFIEGFARRCRKYGGSLITSTQSVNDFYKTEGAKAAYENSDWVLILSQKSESIAELKRSERIIVDRYLEELLESLKVSDGEFSEVVIHGPTGSHVGRLVLDPFSATLYSSSPITFAAIDRLIEAGVPLREAVLRVSRQGDLL